MGRKIPGRKHRGVRDMDKQRQERLDKLKDKVDAPPVDVNDQEIPKSLARLMDLRQKVKSGEIFKKSKPQKKAKKNMPVEFKPSKAGLHGNAGPVYVQGPGETDKSFMLRINKVVKDVLKESAFSEKYKVNIIRNQETGEVEKVEKREKDALELIAEQVKQDKKAMNGKKKKKSLHSENQEKLTKGQRRLQKEKLKREKKNKDIVEDWVEVRHEHVKFGEVAHAPPTLVKPKKVEKSLDKPRPGTKDLLLKSVLGKGNSPKGDSKINEGKVSRKSPKKGVNYKVIDKKGKRKHLPVALRRQLDKQQSEIVQAYKELKKQRYTK